MTRHQEIERKFDAEPDAPLPDLSGLLGEGSAVSDETESQLDATYFDTADAQLARHRVTLRRRTGGDDAGWHLKLPVGPDERIEVRRPPGPANAKVPGALLREVRALVRDQPLIPVARLHTRRVERRLLDGDHNTLAIVADDLVHAERLTDGAVDVSTWREVEVELVNGDRSVLDTVSSRLRAAGLSPSQSSSKLARVLGDLTIRPPAEATADAGKAGRPTAGAVALGYLREQVDQLVSCDRGARSDQPDGVHQMRVACRRIRSTLATFRPLLDTERTDPVRDELSWLGEVLGRARDCEVLRARLNDLAAEQPRELVLGPVRRRLGLELQGRQRAARTDLAAALDSDRYLRLLDALDDLLADPPVRARAGHQARQQIPALVGHAARRVRHDARAVLDAQTPKARDQALHEVRKSAKRARYAAEAAEAVAGRPARRLAKRMTVLQDVLGEHQDSVASRKVLREIGIAAHQSGENGFTFGLLHALEQARAQEALLEYEPALRRASAKKLRRWAR